MKYLLCLTLMFLFETTFSQYVLRGTTIDAKTLESIPYAHVILADSSDGTFSDLDGNFMLKIPSTVSKVIISHVGYNLTEYNLTGENESVKIKIAPLEKQLKAIEVRSEIDKKWRKAFDQFRNELFGENDLTRYCQILNPWVIDFSKQKGAFIAKSDELLEVSNEALGYFVQFRLDEFRMKGTDISLRGEPIGMRDLSTNEEMKSKFEMRRMEAYKGSVFHFFESFVAGELKWNGFRAYLLGEYYYDVRKASNARIQQTKIDSLSEITSKENQLLVDFEGFVQVIYRHPIGGRVETSWLKCNEPVLLDEHGHLYDVGSLVQFGAFANQRLSHYPQPHQVQAYKEQQKSKTK